MDRLNAMTMLVTVAEAGSFSAAARRLRVPLTTLSRKISDLEAHLGARLLIRTTRKLTLTETGIAYVAAARRILEQVDEAEREAAGEFVMPKGELVLTAPVMFGQLHVLPVVTRFLSTWPEITLRMLMSDHNRDLINDHIDMAIRIGELPDSRMVATRIGELRTVTCASSALLDRYGVPQQPQALSQLPCIALDAPLPAPVWRFYPPDTGVPVDIALTPRLIVSSASAVVDAAVLGTGVARLLHYQVADAVEKKQLHIILADCEPPPVPVHLVHASRGQMPLKMRRFLDFAVPALRTSLAALNAGQ